MPFLANLREEKRYRIGEKLFMAMPWGLTIYLMKMVWMVLHGWVSSCLIVADEIARAIRRGDFGPLPVG